MNKNRIYVIILSIGIFSGLSFAMDRDQRGCQTFDSLNDRERQPVQIDPRETSRDDVTGEAIRKAMIADQYRKEQKAKAQEEQVKIVLRGTPTSSTTSGICTIQ